MLLKSRKFLLLLVLSMALLALTVAAVSAGGFNSEPVYNIDDVDYIIKPIPGHEWTKAGPNQAVGKHYNTGPDGASQWWSSDAPDGGLLYIVHGIIDEWTEDKAEQYAARGYVHYHELIEVEGGEPHPTKVIWLKHTARTSFTLDGGPVAPMYAHEVTPGVDFEFIPMGLVPYDPDA